MIRVRFSGGRSAFCISELGKELAFRDEHEIDGFLGLGARGPADTQALFNPAAVRAAAKEMFARAFSDCSRDRLVVPDVPSEAAALEELARHGILEKSKGAFRLGPVGIEVCMGDTTLDAAMGLIGAPGAARAELVVHNYGDIVMQKDTRTTTSYVNNGQAGAMGPDAHVSGNAFQQMAADPHTAQTLLAEIERLQTALRKSDADDADLDAVVQAKLEARGGNLSKALTFLAGRGKKLASVAEEMGLKLLSSWLAAHLGVPPSP